MTAAHLKTQGMICEWCPRLIELSAERLPGVVAARADRDVGVTTVLYDPERIDEYEIADEINRWGFHATIACG